MSVRSVANVSEISVRNTATSVWPEGVVDIIMNSSTGERRGAGTFSSKAVETLINELAAAIGKDVTLSEPPAPKVTLRDLEPGTAFRFGSNPENPVYVKLTGDRLWSNRTERIHPIGADSIREVSIVEAAE